MAREAKKSKHRGTAHVGAHKPFTADDLTRLGSVVANGYFEFRLGPADVINLEYGRDFLVEDKQYDCVLLHTIFHANRPEWLQMAQAAAHTIIVSPKHSLEAWRERLIKTDAKLICAYGGKMCSLEGWHIGDLPGYTIDVRDAMVTMYRRRKR